jgi:WhiB family redox-sensing transcriptional regulator
MTIVFVDRPGWHDDAACRTGTIRQRRAMHKLFFGGQGDHDQIARITAAKAVCARCPVRVNCLEWAIADPHLVGIWGGTTEAERERMRRDKEARRER